MSYDVVSYKNGDKYSGDFDNKGRRSGDGIYNYANGNEYIGEFYKGNKHGYGKLKFYENGKYVGCYEGYFKNGYYDGKGKIHMFDNYNYEGYFKKGKYDGKGKYYSNTGNLKYEGSFKNGNFHGQGQYDEFNNKICYIGSFKKDKFCGKGVLKNFKADTEYTGMFKNDLFNGKGVLKNSKNNTIIAEGIFKDGELVEKISAVAPTVKTNKETEKTKEKLIKSWGQHYDLFEATKSKCNFDYIKKGSFEKIKVQLDNDNFYEGKSLNGKPHGKGILSSSSAITDGYFKEGKVHGPAVIKMKEDNSYMYGLFQNGNLVALTFTVNKEGHLKKYDGMDAIK